MSTPSAALGTLAASLRAARRARGLSIAQLATLAGVSPRLVGELERGLRANVSFDTATRLLALVGVSIAFHRQTPGATDDAARRTRAERRKRTWSGEQTTLAGQAPPPPSSAPAERLTAVARASLLVVF